MEGQPRFTRAFDAGAHKGEAGRPKTSEPCEAREREHGTYFERDTGRWRSEGKLREMMA